MTDFLLSQILAAIALACGVISFQYRARRTVLLWLAAAAVINAGHFFVLGRPGPGTLYALIGARCLAAAFDSHHRLMVLFLALVLAGFVFSYTHPLDWLGLLATLLATYGSFQATDQHVRVAFMLSAAIWVAHNLLAGTPVAALKDGLFLASNLLGYWRWYRRHNAWPAVRPDG